MISDTRAVQAVKEKFNTTFAPLDRGTLNDEQARQLLNTGAAIHMIFHAIKKTFAWANKLANTPERFCPSFIRIFQSVKESSKFYMDKQAQKEQSEFGKQQIEERVSQLRDHFQTLVGDFAEPSFCITSEEARELLAKYQNGDCVTTFEELGQFVRMTPGLTQQDIIDKMEFIFGMARV
jgi:hypothetical protein